MWKAFLLICKNLGKWVPLDIRGGCASECYQLSLLHYFFAFSAEESKTNWWYFMLEVSLIRVYAYIMLNGDSYTIKMLNMSHFEAIFVQFGVKWRLCNTKSQNLPGGGQIGFTFLKVLISAYKGMESFFAHLQKCGKIGQCNVKGGSGVAQGWLRGWLTIRWS